MKTIFATLAFVAALSATLVTANAMTQGNVSQTAVGDIMTKSYTGR